MRIRKKKHNPIDELVKTKQLETKYHQYCLFFEKVKFKKVFIITVYNIYTISSLQLIVTRLSINKNKNLRIEKFLFSDAILSLANKLTVNFFFLQKSYFFATGKIYEIDRKRTICNLTSKQTIHCLRFIEVLKSTVFLPFFFLDSEFSIGVLC